MKREIIRGKFERTKQRIGVMPTRREDSSKKVSIRHDIARLAVEQLIARFCTVEVVHQFKAFDVTAEQVIFFVGVIFQNISRVQIEIFF